MTGRDRTDPEIVQEALWMLKGVLDGRAEYFAEEGCSVEQSLALDEGQELAALGLAALGRLVEALHELSAAATEEEQRLDDLLDVAIQERDEARRDGWYVETLPSGEGAEELAKARRGEGLSVDETGSALRAAMEVADAAKQRGMAAEREARRWMQAATTTCLACSEARERMHEAEDDARIAERETTAALGLVDRQRERTENAEARLERVEAARQETLEWLRARFASDEANSLKAQADLPAVAEFWRGRAGAFVDAAAWLDDVPDFLAAALSDVTPPHDNGESPVDDPECGTDIGPFAAGAVDE